MFRIQLLQAVDFSPTARVMVYFRSWFQHASGVSFLAYILGWLFIQVADIGTDLLLHRPLREMAHEREVTIESQRRVPKARNFFLMRVHCHNVVGGLKPSNADVSIISLSFKNHLLGCVEYLTFFLAWTEESNLVA